MNEVIGPNFRPTPSYQQHILHRSSTTMASSCCVACGKSEGEVARMLKCSVCHKAYCSRDCQTKDFAAHKPSCKEHGVNELLQAIRANDADAVRRLAKIKYVLNGKTDYTVHREEESRVLEKWTALHQCIREDRPEMLRILCAAPGVKIDIKDGDGETPLFCASTDENIEFLRILIEAGAAVNAIAKDGWTALMMAARDGYYDHAELLLRSGADLYLGRDMFGRTCIDLVSGQATGQMGMRMMSREESREEASARHRRMLAMLMSYADDA